MKSNVWLRHTWIALALLALCMLVAGALLYRSLWTRYDGALGQLEAVLEQVDSHPAQLALARSSADLVRNHRAGKASLCLGLEDATPILKDRLDLLRFFYRMGVRYIGLCHMNHT